MICTSLKKKKIPHCWSCCWSLIWWNSGARMRLSYCLTRSGEDAMQKSAGREAEREVGTSCAGDSTVDPHPHQGSVRQQPCSSHRGHSPLVADNLSSLLLLLFQTWPSRFTDSYNVFILFMASSRQGLGLLQGTAALWGAHCPTADRVSEVRAANTSELGMVWLWGATGVVDFEKELNVGRRALWVSRGKYYWVLRWEIMSNPPPQNICVWYIAGRSTLGWHFQLAG